MTDETSLENTESDETSLRERWDKAVHEFQVANNCSPRRARRALETLARRRVKTFTKRAAKRR
jgi:hypothetical protein